MHITEEDLKILKSFLKGKVIENEEEERVLEEYRNIGWTRTGIKKVVKVGTALEVVSTGALTSLGKQFVQREAISRSPWKRFFYRLINFPAG